MARDVALDEVVESGTVRSDLAPAAIQQVPGRRCRTRIARRVGAAVLCWVPVGTVAALAQGAIGVLHEVRIVDTTEGQDVEFATTAQPSDVVPLQRESCTFAVELPNVVPGPEVTSQFFRSELIQNLTVRTASGRAATEICVETAVPVRSRVALRATGMTMRLTRVDDSPPPEARPAELDAAATDAGDAVDAGSREQRASPSAAQKERELTLALREERVARRELQLEMVALRRQLAEQIEANARLDQAATREEAQSDLLEPRIDRLASLVGVESSGTLPVERFDAALAELRSRIEREAEGVDEGRQVEEELERLLAVIDGTDDTLVTTNDAVNVRLGPSTEEIRVAFLPAGVLLRVVERRGPWSRVRSGAFEGWIFDELLEPANLQPLEDRSLPAGSRSERVRAAARSVERLDLDRQLVLQSLEENDRRHEQEQLDALAPLEGRLAQAESELALLRAENERLLSEAEQRKQELAGLERQVADAASGRLEDRVRGLAAWLPETAAESVRVTAATNLRVGPGTEEERLALLPPGFELIVLDRRENWVRVSYGNLVGWMAVQFTEPVAVDAQLGGGAQRLSADLVLDRVERFLSEGLSAPSSQVDQAEEAADGGQESVLRADESGTSSGSDVLRGAADAIYQQFASARRRDAAGFLSFYSEDFEPADGSGLAWRQNITDQIDRGLYAGCQVQNLSLRRVSEDLVEASFLVDGADPEVPRRRRVDLARVEGRWRILVETSAEAPEPED